MRLTQTLYSIYDHLQFVIKECMALPSQQLHEISEKLMREAHYSPIFILSN